MSRFKLYIALLLLLTVSCHNKDKKTTTDTVPAQQETPVAADTLPALPSDTATPSAKPAQATVHRDSIEVTHLRILARRQSVIYSPSDIVGEWIHGTEHEVYLSDGTGMMWDSAEDITRDEAQRFKWTLDSNLLTIVCKLELGGVVPKRYVVTYADDENLAYSDLHGTAYLWDKKTK